MGGHWLCLSQEAFSENVPTFGDGKTIDCRCFTYALVVGNVLFRYARHCGL